VRLLRLSRLLDLSHRLGLLRRLGLLLQWHRQHPRGLWLQLHLSLQPRLSRRLDQ
jgi:hypothetical protein